MLTHRFLSFGLGYLIGVAYTKLSGRQPNCGAYHFGLFASGLAGLLWSLL